MPKFVLPEGIKAHQFRGLTFSTTPVEVEEDDERYSVVQKLVRQGVVEEVGSESAEVPPKPAPVKKVTKKKVTKKKTAK